MSQSDDEIYASGGFSPRAHGQRRDRYLLPDFLSSDGSVNPELERVGFVNNVARVELLGSWHGVCGSALAPREILAWRVVLTSGLHVPAYSLGHQYVVCQHTGYKSYQGE